MSVISHMNSQNKTLVSFDSEIALKYQVFNALFLTLPFEEIKDVGPRLSLFSLDLKSKLEKGYSPSEIVESFFFNPSNNSAIKEKDLPDNLFQFLQFIERQVVLFDALEEAAFEEVHDLNGDGTLSELFTKTQSINGVKELHKKLQDYKVRIVLTAHPTQFYPNSVLGIISDLCVAIKDNKLEDIRNLLLQMGKTRFKNKEKPTPLEEAESLIWYLENVFYEVIPSIQNDINNFCRNHNLPIINKPLIELGFWPGGDRDGNPFVTAETTKEVAATLKHSISNLYIKDIKELKRRLTFEGVEEILDDLESLIERSIESGFCNANFRHKGQSVKESGSGSFSSIEILKKLEEAKEILITKHQSLFLDDLNIFIQKVNCFGMHFASLDLRQDSRVHAEVLEEVLKKEHPQQKEVFNYSELTAKQKINFLKKLLTGKLQKTQNKKPQKKLANIASETLSSIKAAKEVRQLNGNQSLERYIISNTRSVLNIWELLTIIQLGGMSFAENELSIVPLFETIDDLVEAESIMKELYEDKLYRKHLSKFNDVQTIMLGFSDGTKDGGYVTANSSILWAKQRLSKLSREYGIKVL
ncbi:MAG TPA: phosphoenolpyruvate carboxylase, partial [Vampirovibrionales bacterium]